jgi:uncharacterized membrane protein
MGLIGLAIYLIVRRKHAPKESIAPLPAKSMVQATRTSFIKSQIAATIVGILLVVFLSLFLFIIYEFIPCPRFMDYSLCLWPAVAFPMFFGYVFGPVVGFTTGFLGGIIVDNIIAGEIWLSLDIGLGLEGFLMGLATLILPERKRRENTGLLWCSLLAVVSSFANVSFALLTDRFIGYGLPPELYISIGVDDAIDGAIFTPMITFIYYRIKQAVAVAEAPGKPERGAPVSVPIAPQAPLRGTKPITTEILNEELLRAAEKGDTARVRELLEEGADVGARDTSYSNTPLHWAAYAASVSVAELLIKHGADVNSRNRYGWTPLHYAACGGYRDVVKLLIKSGADVNAREVAACTPLHVAISCGPNYEVVKLLLENGAHVNARDNGGQTPLHWAAQKGHVGVVKLLLQNGADPSIRNNEGKTPIDIARERGHVEVARIIEEFIKPRTPIGMPLPTGYLAGELARLNEEAKQYREYLTRLEAFKAEGKVTGAVYEQLRREYMSKLEEIERRIKQLTAR